MGKFFDLADPFYAPLSVRLSIVVLTAGWGLFEASNGAMVWAIMFWGISGYCAWQFATIDYTVPRDDDRKE